MSKVAVALSGGVDSSVTAFLLKQQGYEVVGVTAKTTCSSEAEQVIENARTVAKKLEIPFYPLDVTEIFREKVINYFENSYRIGETEVDGIFKFYPASDEHKDQLYFLFMLDQEHLKKTIFPLSNYCKDEVRKIAFENDLPSKSSKESQDICFIKAPMTTKKYLNNLFTPQRGKFKRGKFIEAESGKVLGEHEGFWQFTIGQRKGIGLAASEALYVTGIDANTNTVYVGFKDKLYADYLTLNNINWSYPVEKSEFEALAKIRYNMKAVNVNVIRDGAKTIIRFPDGVSALANGQACVLYDKNDGHLLGGAFIQG